MINFFGLPTTSTPQPQAPKQVDFAYPGISRPFTPQEKQQNQQATAPAAPANDLQNQIADAYTPPAGPVAPTAAQTDPLIAALGSLDEILSNKNDQSQAEYNRAIQGYNAQDALDKAAYDKNVHQNEQSLTANDQAALLNAANAGTGLRGVMASLGSLAGSGADVIRRLVGLAANQDAGSAHQNFATNADNLTTAWSQAEQEQRQRRQDAKASLDNELQNNKAGILNSRQSIYQQLANLWGDGTSQGNDYASKASALAPEIAATTKATVAPYAKASSSFAPGALKQYLAGTTDLNVSTDGSQSATPVNSPLFANGQKKDRLAGVA